MKIEIEVTEQDVREAVGRQIAEAVSAQSLRYQADEYIKAQVKAMWTPMVDQMIRDAIANSKAMRGKIADEIERKLRAQIGAVMRKA